jgi:hypothetical protein
MSGAWAWLQFHNAPWEGDSQYYGTSLAAYRHRLGAGRLQIRAGNTARPQASARVPGEGVRDIEVEVTRPGGPPSSPQTGR